MRRFLMVVVPLVPGVASAQKWQDATAACLGTTAQWTNKVEVADVDGDGKVDLLLANGGNYSSPGQPEATRVFKNTWGDTTSCTEISAQAVGGFTGLSRMIKAGDIDGDGDLDLLTGGAYQTQLRLFVREGSSWTDATAQLPQHLTSIGDAEFGDVDRDGDLDIVLADWGTMNPGAQGYAGGRTRLYVNEGGTFLDATFQRMPAVFVKWSWDIELADTDNDWDLDILVACKLCTTSYLFFNNGFGLFGDSPDALPHFPNNYEFEPMDIDSDGDLDLVTINDGPNVTEHILINIDGKFNDQTSMRLTGAANPAGADDNVAAWLDYDADGDADLLIGSLGTDRLLENSGVGSFTLVPDATPNDTNATLGLAVADFDGDGRLDLLQGQGEIQNSLADKLQLATSMIAVDTVAPSIRVADRLINDALFARVHDLIAPSHAHDFQSVTARAGSTEIPMTYAGGMLWRAAIPAETRTTSYEVCATDRQGNKRCVTTTVPGPDAGMDPDGQDPNDGPRDGGCCETGKSDPRGAVALALFVVIGLSVRRPRRRGA